MFSNIVVCWLTHIDYTAFHVVKMVLQKKCVGGQFSMRGPWDAFLGRALSERDAQSASPLPSNVPITSDGQYRSRCSLLPDMPPANYRKTM